MTDWVADAHAHVQRLVLVVKMATFLEDCTTEEQRYFVRFCEQEGSMQMILKNKYSLFAVGSVCRVKRFITGARNVVHVSLMAKRLKQEVRSGRDNSQKTSMLRLSTH
jgi:hypothetical protein